MDLQRERIFFPLRLNKERGVKLYAGCAAHNSGAKGLVGDLGNREEKGGIMQDGWITASYRRQKGSVLY